MVEFPVLPNSTEADMAERALLKCELMAAAERCKNQETLPDDMTDEQMRQFIDLFTTQAQRRDEQAQLQTDFLSLLNKLDTADSTYLLQRCEEDPSLKVLVVGMTEAQFLQLSKARLACTCTCTCKPVHVHVVCLCFATAGIQSTLTLTLMLAVSTGKPKQGDSGDEGGEDEDQEELDLYRHWGKLKSSIRSEWITDQDTAAAASVILKGRETLLVDKMAVAWPSEEEKDAFCAMLADLPSKPHGWMDVKLDTIFMDPQIDQRIDQILRECYAQDKEQDVR